MKVPTDPASLTESLKTITRYLPAVVIAGLSYWVLKLDDKNENLHKDKDKLQEALIKQKADEADYLRHAFDKSTELYKILLQNKENHEKE